MALGTADAVGADDEVVQAARERGRPHDCWGGSIPGWPKGSAPGGGLLGDLGWRSFSSWREGFNKTEETSKPGGKTDRVSRTLDPPPRRPASTPLGEGEIKL